MALGNRISEGANAIYDGVEAHCEEFIGKESGANGMAEELETMGEFDREWLHSLISRVGCDGVGDNGGWWR